MTTTSPTSSTTSPTSAAVASSSTSGSTSNTGLAQLADNFNSFLTLLTTQLQNQDPLDPLDTNQFTQQLVEFTGVQQQVDMNTNLQTLISLQQTSEATSAMQYLGSSVTLSGSSATLASGSPATWALNSPSPATAQVTITNASGQVAYNGTTSLNAGTQTYSWNGQGNNGVTWPAGQYTLAINATGASGQTVTVTTQIQGTVSGVDLSQNPPQLTVNGQSYPITAVQSINSGSTSVLGSLNSSIGSLNTSIGNLTELL
ncbi:MAG TPA: flagellar hook capping FlgD N-terminal domain-containing protein [Xanthobacteraceae bacterium]|jgi:flagellar basal-body rod modification protein FlgD|nr:flagellar hook capping FlgD N-terminal domain-containing protein [Xanthobacteraceae bacterium]